MAPRPIQRAERDPALEQALNTRMAVTEIAETLGISRAAVSQWRRVPEKHLAVVARITRISKRRLRPDLYPAREPAE
jgi:DNA-binding transcriptional regulator YdaS (Cro superfamily)